MTTIPARINAVNLSDGAIRFYRDHVCPLAVEEGYTYAYLDTLADRIGKAKRTIEGYLCELRRASFIATQRGRGKRYFIQPLIPAAVVPDPGRMRPAPSRPFPAASDAESIADHLAELSAELHIVYTGDTADIRETTTPAPADAPAPVVAPMDKPQGQPAPERPAPASTPTPEPPAESVALLESVTVPAPVARKLAQGWSHERIRDVVAAYRDAKGVRCAAAWIRAALSQGWTYKHTGDAPEGAVRSIVGEMRCKPVVVYSPPPPITGRPNDLARRFLTLRSDGGAGVMEGAI